MALKFHKFQSISAMDRFLNGRIAGGVDIPKTHSALYLHGKTLVFTTPAEEEVIFEAAPATAQVPLTMAQLVEQIEDQATGVKALINREGQLEMYMEPPGEIVLASSGTANRQLGFSSSSATSNTPCAAPGAAEAPRLVQIIPDTGSNGYLVVTDDTVVDNG